MGYALSWPGIGLLKAGCSNKWPPSYDALKSDPFSATTPDQIRARLAAEHTKRK